MARSRLPTAATTPRALAWIAGATHSRAIFDALASTDKTYIDFPNALHYFEPDAGEADNAGAQEQMAQLLPWLQERAPL